MDVGLQGVYTWLDGRPTPGKQAMLMYNRDASELRHKKELILHLGCNNWAGQKKEVCAWHGFHMCVFTESCPAFKYCQSTCQVPSIYV